MLTLEDARAAILERIVPGDATETLALLEAHGRFAAAELRAVVDNPAFDNSAMDGYAVRAVDVAANPVLPLVGEAGAGTAPAELVPMSCMRIFTGAPVPAGADAVVIQEDVVREGETVRFAPNVKPGAHVRRRGEDFRRGELLYGVGQRLRSMDLALLATAGVAEVPVFRRPRVLVVATGDELVAPGTPLAPGQIYESNRLATLAQLGALGAQAIDGGTVRDDAVALRALLERAREYDFVITSGGASVGDHDLVKRVFAEIGEIHFWKVRIKPGKPLAFGRVGAHTHFFALPGNPVSSLVTFRLFVVPALHAWHRAVFEERSLPATVTNELRRQPGRTEFLRARLYVDRGRFLADVLSGQGSHRLGPMREANGFIRLEADSDGFAAGASVLTIPFD